MRVLTKPELNGAIVLQELLQVMENLGLYDDSQEGEGEGDEDEDDDDENQGIIH